MASGKARFTGKVELPTDWKFSQRTRQKIRQFYSDQKYKKTFKKPGEWERFRDRQHNLKLFAKKEGETYTELSEFFVNDIEREARWAKHELFHLSHEGSKDDVRDELNKILTRAEYLKKNLPQLSLDVRRIIPVRFDPLLHAKNLGEMCDDIKVALGKVPDKKPLPTAQHEIAVEMAIRVLRVVKQYGIKILATAHPKDYWFSNAVEIMSCIGKAIDHDLAETTWRDIILSARNKAPDLAPQDR